MSLSSCRLKETTCFFKIRALLRYCDLGTYASGTEVLKLILKLYVLVTSLFVIFLASFAVIDTCCTAKKSGHWDPSTDIFKHRMTFIASILIIMLILIYTLWKGIQLKHKKMYLRCHLLIVICSLIPIHVIGRNFFYFAWKSSSAMIRTFDGIQFFMHLMFSIYEIIMVWRCYRKLDSPLMWKLNNYCSSLRDNSFPKRGRDEGYDGIDLIGATTIANPQVDYKSFRMHVISPLDVTVDTSCTLGEGQFGKVYKGILMASISKSKIPIAAKVAKNTDNSGDFNMLLQEMKIMIHVGEHKHIVKFFGVTSDATVKEHFAVILELCDNGCLDDFLKLNRQTFIDVLQTNNLAVDPSQTNTYVNVIGQGSYSTLDLIRFASEIAEGMDHLTSKGVIHGDLACRNVLLTRNLSTKLTDFGMARRLYNYQTYATGGQQSFLPWRWMSIEALEDLKFSDKSDVWAYGVTLWEIFSLGGFPYEEIKWSPKIPFQLRNALKLQKPQYANEKIYEIMNECWNVNCDRRPSFSDLTATISQELLNSQQPQR